MMNNHRRKQCLGIILPFAVGRECQDIFLCVSYVLCHRVVYRETLFDLGSPFDSHSVFCSFVVFSPLNFLWCQCDTPSSCAPAPNCDLPPAVPSSSPFTPITVVCSVEVKRNCSPTRRSHSQLATLTYPSGHLGRPHIMGLCPSAPDCRAPRDVIEPTLFV